VLKIITDRAQNDSEVMTMDEINVGRRDVSGLSSKLAGTKETPGSERTGYRCFEQCMNDPWEMKGESVCSSVCGL
jgi:hypothetical protein